MILSCNISQGAARISGASVHGASSGPSGSFPLVEQGVSNPGNNLEMNMLRGAAPRDTGKSPIFQATGVSNMPFKEQHLKQLRAQCLVFLAFRYGTKVACSSVFQLLLETLASSYTTYTLFNN